MDDTASRAIAVVGMGATLPDAPQVGAFWQNLIQGRYSISEVSQERWDPNLYYDPDPQAPDKCYSKIGGWVRQADWDPVRWRLAIPPLVVESMDETQRWALACTRQALLDYGYPDKPLDSRKTAVILGNAMGGERHYWTALRIYFPEYLQALLQTEAFSQLDERAKAALLAQYHQQIASRMPEITEDSMPGELANCMAGRIANVFNFNGPNYTCDAACASAMAAVQAAIAGLVDGSYDAVVTGGVDRNMGASTFVKFCKIGALSASGTRPYADGADGFVMGEGAAIFLLKRLADAEEAGDKIYAVIRGIGASSDGKGKGITAPNPIGQKLAIERGWKSAGLRPIEGMLIEGHGTSTKVGDMVEMQSLAEVFGSAGLRPQSAALGSVKSNIGHLKAAAGAAGLLKAVLALHNKMLPPSLHFERPNPNFDFARAPFYVNTKLQPWERPANAPRTACVSAFGFGGTNFHIVLEEYVPGRLKADRPKASGGNGSSGSSRTPIQAAGKDPLRGALLLGANSENELLSQLKSVKAEAEKGNAPRPSPPSAQALRAPQRLSIDYASAEELASKANKALRALESKQAPLWKSLRAQGVFRGSGAPSKVAFLYSGQGSQYVNMLREFRDKEPIVNRLFEEADRIMLPKIGKLLSSVIFVDPHDSNAITHAEKELQQTAITQPAVLTVDIALTELMKAYGIVPDMVMGHSLGEYGALVAAKALPFEDALEAVAARGREMSQINVPDNGKMFAVMAPIERIEQVVQQTRGYVVIANINSRNQAVIGGASEAVMAAGEVLNKEGFTVIPLSVSHAFHTSIVAPASEPLRKVLTRLRVSAPQIPLVANVDGEFYPQDLGAREKMIDILARQVASPVQFVKGLERLYAAGARTFVEVGPKKALHGFVDEVLGDRDGVLALFTNHPKLQDLTAFNQALCGLYAQGHGLSQTPERAVPEVSLPQPQVNRSSSPAAIATRSMLSGLSGVQAMNTQDRYMQVGKLFVDFLEQSSQMMGTGSSLSGSQSAVISGASLGVPGTEKLFSDDSIAKLLEGEQFIDLIPMRLRKAIASKHITRVVKSAGGEGSFETIDSPADVIKLAGRAGKFDLESEYGVSAERLAALDQVTRLAIAAGLDALRDAGIPLVMRYKTASTGKQLPDGWALPESMRDDTGVIFASAFPGLDSYTQELERYFEDQSRRARLSELTGLRQRTTDSQMAMELDRRIADLQTEITEKPYIFDRRFLFRVLSMGHSQFAEFIRARGPNTAINAACASTTQAVSLAQDWLANGRCQRVIVISADDITTDHLMEWFGAGFLATGAAATDELVEEAATPFDRRRHGMIVGMGAAAIVLETPESIQDRGLIPICEVLSTITANSAYHGTRLDVQHISQIMEKLVSQAEQRWGLRREQMASQMVFVSHETYTPARGGSASAEIQALRSVFGPLADQIVIANTKGFTGHAMGAGIEDVLAIKALETGMVPPVPNFKEPDPELGELNLSRGGSYPVEFALRLGAGFGSQISMSLYRRTMTGARPSPRSLGFRNRIADPSRWQAWLEKACRQQGAMVEVVNRTLRIVDKGPAKDWAPSIRQEMPAQRPMPQPLAAPMRPAPMMTPPMPKAPEMRPAWNPPPVQDPVFARAETMPSSAMLSAVQTQAPVQPLPAMSPSAAGVDPLQEQILSLVAAKTGYPRDMLALDLDLEADLGIDTVKQADIFASLRSEFNIPRDENLKLRDYPTLAQVVRFVRERSSAAQAPNSFAPSTAAAYMAPPPVAVSTPSAAPQPSGSQDTVRERVLSIVAAKTGYPLDMLAPDLDLEADLGIDTVKQAEVFASIRAEFDIPRDENLKLRDYPTLDHVVRFVYERSPKVQAQAPAASAPLPTAPDSAQSDIVRERVLAIVAAKTGYPLDMLAPDLDLEADLGIDTVKQAEVFASIRAEFEIPRDENLKLRDYPTLDHVVRFVHERSPRFQSKASPEKAPSETAQPSAQPENGTMTGEQALLVYPRRVPVPMLRPALSQCKPTQVRLETGRRVILMTDQLGVGPALYQALTERGVQVLVVEDCPDMAEMQRRIQGWLSEGPVHGVFWLSALDREPSLSEMDLQGWKDATQRRVKLLYATMRALYKNIEGADTFLMSATRMGGRHGYDPSGALSGLAGAVSGFTKAFKRERPNALVKCVDFADDCAPEELTRTLIDETLTDPGIVEVGHWSGLRWTPGLEEQPAMVESAPPAMTLGKETVLVITGAAGSIVSAITADLAHASGGIFHLLDLAPAPNDTDPDLMRFGADPDGLRRELFERLKAKGERATPAMVEKEMAKLERIHAAHQAMRAIQKAGGSVSYHQVNLLDAAKVDSVIGEIRARHGKVDVLMHAAGLEISRLLPDKSPEEFNLVFDVKADGWFNLMRAIGDMPLGSVVVFSSIAGRFGNGGQADYSSANDLLCKSVSQFRNRRPETRGIAIDWTAWSGIGMASRGSIPKMMELAGIDMLPPEIGIPVVRRELTASAPAGEVVIAGSLGVLLKEWDEQGGIDPSRVDISHTGPMIGKVVSMGLSTGIVVETTLDPKEQGFLHDHAIEGTPVLPGVMGIEGFAEIASLLLPDWRVQSIEQVEFLAPFKFYRSEPRTLTLSATLKEDGESMVAECKLLGQRTLPGQAEPQWTTHFTGRVRLSRRPPEEMAMQAPVQSEVQRPVGASDIYRIYFHGPAYRVLERGWREQNKAVALTADKLPSNHTPPERQTVLSPRLIESCFQTAGLWQMGTEGRMGLPRHIERLLPIRNDDLSDGHHLFVIAQPSQDGYDACIVDQEGRVYVQLFGYRTIELPAGITPELLQPLQEAMKS